MYSALQSVPYGHIDCSRGMGIRRWSGLGTGGASSEAGTCFAGHVPPDEPLNAMPLLVPSLANLRPPARTTHWQSQRKTVFYDIAAASL